MTVGFVGIFGFYLLLFDREAILFLTFNLAIRSELPLFLRKIGYPDDTPQDNVFDQFCKLGKTREFFQAHISFLCQRSIVGESDLLEHPC